MSSSGASSEENGQGEVHSDAEPVIDGNGQGEGRKSAIERLVAESSDDQELQPILHQIATMVDEGEDLEAIESLLLSITRRWSGPLPSPEHLADYENVLPGLAGRIVSMAEREQEHRIEIQSSEQRNLSKIVHWDIVQSYLGTILGFIFLMSSLIVGVWLAANGHWRTGLPFGLIPPGIIFAMFAYQFWPMFRKPRDGPEDDEER